MRWLLLLAIAGSTAMAQEAWKSSENLNRKPTADAAKERPNGWTRDGVVNVGVSLTSSQDVVGQTDGTSQTYSTNSKGEMTRWTEQSEWRNEIFLREATTKTPSLPRFIKSDDELKLSTIYLYSLPSMPKVGPYARAEASAPLFKGEDVRPEAKLYRVTHANGTVDPAFTASSIRLTDGLRPLTTREAFGFFYKPITEEKLKIETRLGFAAQQIAASGQYSIKGVNANGEIDVNELRDVSQAGLEAAVNVKGTIDERTSYEAGAESLTPFVNNKPASDKRDAWRLTNVTAYAKLTSKLNDWMSFGYDYKLKIEPQLVDRAQQIHMVVLNLTYPTPSGK